MKERGSEDQSSDSFPLLFYSLPSFDFSIVFKLGTGFRLDLLLSLGLSVLDVALVSFAVESLEELSEKLPLPPAEILFLSQSTYQ